MRKLFFGLLTVGTIGYIIYKGVEAANHVSYKIKGYGTPKINFPFVSVPVIVELNNPLPTTTTVDRFIAVVSYQQGDAYQEAGTISKQNLQLQPGPNTITIDTVISLQALSKNILQTFITVLQNKFINIRTDISVIIQGVEAKKTFINQIDLPSSPLGLVPAANRQVSPMPASLKNLVPKPIGKNENVKEANADPLRDTVPLIKKIVKRTLYQTERLAAQLKGKSTFETVKNDFDLIFKHIAYKTDADGIEQIRSPRRTIWEGAGDCDCFTTLLSSLLTNQKIGHDLRVAAYTSDEYCHIYVNVPGTGDYYITVDPVTNKFNYEVTPISSLKDYPMPV